MGVDLPKKPIERRSGLVEQLNADACFDEVNLRVSVDSLDIGAFESNQTFVVEIARSTSDVEDLRESAPQSPSCTSSKSREGYVNEIVVLSA